MKFWDKLNKNVLILALVYLVGISAICTCRFTFNFWISIFIFPPCLIYFNRKTNPKIGLPLFYVGMVFGWSISLFNLLVTSAGWGWAILANILYATIYFIPFILDKLVFNKFFNNNIQFVYYSL